MTTKAKAKAKMTKTEKSEELMKKCFEFAVKVNKEIGATAAVSHRDRQFNTMTPALELKAGKPHTDSFEEFFPDVLGTIDKDDPEEVLGVACAGVAFFAFHVEWTDDGTDWKRKYNIAASLPATVEFIRRELTKWEAGEEAAA